MALDTDKLNYSIGQVAEIIGVAQSTLRYWETVIHLLKPQKTAGGSRRYTKDTIELILIVKDLLHEQGLTIKGANLYLKKYKDGKVEDNPNLGTDKATIVTQNSNPIISDNIKSDYDYLKKELLEINKILE